MAPGFYESRDHALASLQYVEASHCGCSFGLCTRLDPINGDHDWYEPNEPQLKKDRLPEDYFVRGTTQYATQGNEMTNFVKVANVADVPPGERIWHDFEDETVVIFNVDGNFYCIADRCTHDDGPLGDGTFDVRNCEIHCPRHGAIFDIRTGEALALPAVKPVPTFAVKVEGDEIWVESPDEAW